MRIHASRLGCGLAAAALLSAGVGGATAQPVMTKTGDRVAAVGKPPALAPGCARKSARGTGPTRHHARLKSWELIAQSTGNWPLATDILRNERYACRQLGAGWRCAATIDVCRNT